MVAERGNGETTVLRPWVPRWILGCLFAVVSAVAHYTAELTEGRELVGLTGSVWSFLPTAGFVVALVSLPRISQTTARPYYVATTVVAVLSLSIGADSGDGTNWYSLRQKPYSLPIHVFHLEGSLKRIEIHATARRVHPADYPPPETDMTEEEFLKMYK